MLIKKILVTGATGFIGKSLISRLRGEVVICALNHTSSKGGWDSEIVCDLSKDVIPEIAVDGVDTIIHMAAVTHDASKTTKLKNLYQNINVDATLILAELAAKNNVKRFVFISSVKAGGTPNKGECANELEQGIPDGTYGCTKRKAEIELLKIGKLTGMHVIIIRPALIYGPGVKGNLKSMLNGITHGWFPPLPDTSNVRSMIHIDDLVNAIILVLDKEQAHGEIFIVTDGRKYSSREIYNEMCASIGKKSPKWTVSKYFFFILAKTGDIISVFVKFPFDTNRYQKLLGDDCFCSNKIRKVLGFQSIMTLKDALPYMIEENKR